MIGKLFDRLHRAERRLARSTGREIQTAAGRRAAWWHYQLLDHGFIRVLWTNLYEIAPGVWRSNQPSAGRLDRYYAMGIRTILNLRGRSDQSFHLFEVEAATRLGLEMINLPLSARRLAPREVFLELFDIFDRIQRPFVMHCKSGADRAGLASALWLLHMEGATPEVAARQLSLRFAHVKQFQTGVLDRLLATYAADARTDPMPVRQWFQTRYDPAAISAAFERDGA